MRKTATSTQPVPTQLAFSNSDPKGESRTFRSRERKVHAQNERYKERYFHESFVPWNFQIPILCNFRSLELSLSKETIKELSFPNCAYRRGAIKNQRQSIEMFERRLAYLLPFISYTLVCRSVPAVPPQSEDRIGRYEKMRKSSRCFFKIPANLSSSSHSTCPRYLRYHYAKTHHFLAKNQFTHEKVLFIHKLWPTPLPTNTMIHNPLYATLPAPMYVYPPCFV